MVSRPKRVSFQSRDEETSSRAGCRPPLVVAPEPGWPMCASPEGSPGPPGSASAPRTCRSSGRATRRTAWPAIGRLEDRAAAAEEGACETAAPTAPSQPARFFARWRRVELQPTGPESCVPVFASVTRAGVGDAGLDNRPAAGRSRPRALPIPQLQLKGLTVGGQPNIHVARAGSGLDEPPPRSGHRHITISRSHAAFSYRRYS